MTQCRTILLLQTITKLFLFTIELKLRDDFRCFRLKMCFRTFSTVPLNSTLLPNVSKADSGSWNTAPLICLSATVIKLKSLVRLDVVADMN